MVKNNRIDENDLREGNAEKARLTAAEVAREQSRIREEEERREHRDDNGDGLDDR